MGTKNDPGPYDCLAKVEPDEPLFTLIARDPLAPQLVRSWADRAAANGEDPAKVEEARRCAAQMEVWRRLHR